MAHIWGYFVEHLIKVLCDYVKYLNWIDAEILSRRGIYRKSRPSLDYVSIISVWNSDEMPPQKESLWSQILGLKKDGWKISYFARYQDDFVTILRTATPHKLPPFTPCVFKNPSKYPSPKNMNLPDCESIERFLLEQDLVWIIEKNYQQKKEWFERGGGEGGMPIFWYHSANVKKFRWIF
ncbi:nuclear cap-binding protein subunit 1-A [Trichinella spiralis]|uniref:nuclear cap-binding protein subunit 1-A n=1 Tax=Trichinella spiralis TaxID=6334 RepID=UPI0001EFE2B2|nr:nuclear cap-binding protein subunit 1-A [Trichinella spiralis]